MGRNTFDVLNAALFAQMERLASASDEELEREIERSKAVSQLAGNVIGNARTAIDLMRFQANEELGLSDRVMVQPKMLGGGE